MADVSLAPIINALAPLAVSVTGVIISAAVAWLAQKGGALLHVKIEQSAIDKITQAAQHEAGALIAAAQGNLAAESIKVSDPRIADAAGRIVATMPDVIKAAGLTPTAVATAVAGELGRMTAPAAPPAPATPKPS